MLELSIVQPYVPAYRVPFFEGLRATLESDEVRVRVIAGAPRGIQAARGDAAKPDWLEEVRPRAIAVGARSLSLTHSRPLWRGSDAVIVPHQGTSFDALSALLFRGDRRVGVWGHIAPYTSPLNRVDGAIEAWQLRRADQVFAYTGGGRQFAREAGVVSDKITVVMNTVDTDSLVSYLRAITPAAQSAFLREKDIPSEHLVGYIGGLDASKRIDFLASVMDELWAKESKAHFLVAGTGASAQLLERAAARGQATLLGYVDGLTKAHLLKAVRFVVNPGRVGLIAVDCLAAQRPLLTTRWPWHAPEIDYLEEGKSLFTFEDNPVDAAVSIEAALEEAPGDGTSWPPAPTLADMVGNFREGVLRMLR